MKETNEKKEINKYRDWELYDVLPAGWKIDKNCGSPLTGYVFCTDCKSILRGGKRALLNVRKIGV